MSTFPALHPASRTFTPGTYPHKVLAGYSGRENRIRRNNVMQGSDIRLSFIGLSESQMLSVLSHYQGQYGQFAAFELPTSVWNGLSDKSTFTLPGYLWRYREPPSVEDLPHGGYVVNVALESVPTEGAIVAGQFWNLRTSFASGAATVNALPVTITLSFAPGTAAGAGDTAGLATTITVQFDAGAPINIPWAGLSHSVSVSNSFGTALGGSSVNGLSATVTSTLTFASNSDENYNNVSLLLKFDGSNNSTTFADSSKNQLSVSRNGNPVISTAQKKFGSSSLWIDGAVSGQDYVSVAASSLFDVGAGTPFSVELWFRAFSNTSISGGIVGQRTSQFPYVPFVIRQEARNLQWFIGNAAATAWHSSSTSTGNLITAGTWHFLQLVGDGSNLYLRLDGTQILTTSQPNWASANRMLVFGSSGSGQDYHGYIDEARFTLGVARPNVVPTTEFPVSSSVATGGASSLGLTETIDLSLVDGVASV